MQWRYLKASRNIVCRNLISIRIVLNNLLAPWNFVGTFLIFLKIIFKKQKLFDPNCWNIPSCRNTQMVLDDCVLKNLQIERPSYGYFCEAKVHDTKRPKPEPHTLDHPDGYSPPTVSRPYKNAKFGLRSMWT